LISPVRPPVGGLVLLDQPHIPTPTTTHQREWKKKLSRLHWIRKNRFRHAVATFARQLIKDLYTRGVSTIVIDELTGIRENSQHGRQGNMMVHNHWSHKYDADRLRWTAEQYGMDARTISEAYTSQPCPRCSRDSQYVPWGFRCLDCGLQAHRDGSASWIWLSARAGTLSGQRFGICFHDGMDAGGTATTKCPPNRRAGWKHGSPDLSRGVNQY